MSDGKSSTNGITLYLKIDRNVLVKNPSVVLKDIAKITCVNESVVNKLKTLKVFHFHEPTSGSKKKCFEVFSVLKIIELIGKEYPGISVENIGEADFVLEYEPKETNKWTMMLKLSLSCILVFFGAAFTIMSFNNDTGITDVFSRFYRQIMGHTASGVTVLEVCYSIGLGLGILVFFNHVGHKKVTSDPTPMQVQMRKYEKDVDTTFIENSSRKGSNQDVG